MGYTEHLKNLLRPLRLYELEEGLGAAELTGVGGAMDEVEAALGSALREALPPTSTGDGLAAYESILPYKPCRSTLEDRRRAVASLLRIDGASFTPEAINATIAGCGIQAVAEETGSRTAVQVRFSCHRGRPDDLDELAKRIEAILPCHLDVVYKLAFVTWTELEAFWPTWALLSDVGMTWNVLERSGGD